MAGESALTVRFGGDTTGLDSAIAVAKAQVKSFDAEVRYFAESVASSSGHFDAHLGAALKNASAAAASARRELASLSRKPLDEAANGAAAFNKKLDSLALFAWNNTNLSGNEIERVVNPIKGLANSIGVVPAIATAAAAAIGYLAYKVGDFAQDQLAELGKVSKETGLSANSVQSAKIVGARSGLGSEETVAALKNANEEYQKFQRNTGEVKDALDKIDKEFLKVLDGAKSSGEFIDLVGQKIRALPRQEGIDLINALWGSDTGEKLYEPIVRGELEMKNLSAAAQAAGVSLNESLVKSAEETKRKIEEASVITDIKLLTALQGLAAPVAELKLEFHHVVGEIADATTKAVNFVSELHKGVQALADMAKAKADLGGGVPFKDAFAGYSRGLMGSEVQGPKQQQDAGISRARYAARDDDKSKSGKGGKDNAASEELSRAKKEIDDEIAETQRGLTAKEGLIQQEVALFQIGQDQKIAKLRVALDEQYADQLALLEREKALEGQKPAAVQAVNDKIKALESKHADDIVKLNNEAALNAMKPWFAATDALASSFGSAMSGLISHTQRFADAAKNIVKSLMSSLLNSAVQSMANTAKGFLSTALGAAGGAAPLGGLASLFSGFTMPTLSLPSFDVGAYNIDQTQLALVHKNEMIMTPSQADGVRNMINGSSGSNVEVHNYAPGVQVQPEMTDDRVKLHIFSALGAFSKQVPGLVANAQKRTS
jgi:hypothetical protein